MGFVILPSCGAGLRRRARRIDALDAAPLLVLLPSRHGSLRLDWRQYARRGVVAQMVLRRPSMRSGSSRPPSWSACRRIARELER